MSAGSPPTPPTPGASAQAETGSEAAGTMMDIADAPIMGYANAYTSAMVNPYNSALSSALSNQTAMQSAQGQNAIESAVNPGAFNARAMMTQGANKNLGYLYGDNPTSASYTAPGAFAVPSLSDLPNLSTISAGANAIAGNIQGVTLNKDGTNPQLQAPTKPGPLPAQSLPNNYLYGLGIAA